MGRKTCVSVKGQAFFINDQITYKGRYYKEMKIEGLLMNSRMVQGIFDDLNPETRSRWDYPDGPWDPQRNTDEFIANMPKWRNAGLLSFTINLQGGSPEGYSHHQPWTNSAFDPSGELRSPYMNRLEQILDKADELDMVPIVGLFYFGQSARLESEQAVIRAVENATQWLLDKAYRNVLIEIGNEIDLDFGHSMIEANRCDELITRVQRLSANKVDSPAGRLLVGTSMRGGSIPPNRVVLGSDIILLHGNGVSSPDRIRRMVDRTRELPSYRGQPILFNEDDHFDFEADDNNMLAAVSRYASWGYFDYRLTDEGYDEGFQSVPINWDISSPRKQSFFRLLTELTGS